MRIALLWLLAGCTPADIDYCRGFGVEGTTEYAKCLDHAHAEASAFAIDREQCALEADGVYPPSLYEYRRRPSFGYGVGQRGYYRSGGFITIEPDFRRNAQIDYLRARIITPCMQARGWNSPDRWQDGQRQTKLVKPSPRRRHTAGDAD